MTDDDASVNAAMEAVDALQRAAESRELYSKMRSEREKATFAMMMRMNPEALMNIRKEFFARRDAIDLDEFIFIIQKHLTKTSSFETREQREFGMKMFELFRDIDVNGDGQLEWQEFTTYVVEKANLLNKRLKLTSIAHYYESSESLDSSAQYRHRHDISKMVKIPSLCQFAMVEDHKNSIFIFNSRLGKHVTTITTESAPVSLEHIPDKDILVSSNADMTLATYSLDDPNPNRRYKQKTTWATPGVQMALAYMPANNLLYSGGTNGNLYSWKIAERSLVSTFTGHTDIVMALTVLKKLNNIASGSLDKTVNVWDSYTNARILELHGHKKGVLDMTYSHEYRLLFSCGFEHDACIWSPFVNSLVYRLKGHHASLVGIEAVEDTPEIITADISGVFKLWDIRNYQCVQTLMTNLTGSDMKDSSKLSCFFHMNLPPRNSKQKEDDSRIYAASKMLFAFDQARVVHDATTDFSTVIWIGWSQDSSVFFTASERNVIVWDALIGSKTVENPNICGKEISAVCLDDRKRKMVIGDINGKIGVYNPSNGQVMKTVHGENTSTVVALEYVDESRRFIAGFLNGIMQIYDENSLEDCTLVRTFEAFNMHPELLCLSFSAGDRTVATAGASSGVARLWDYSVGKSEVELKVCDAMDYVVHVIYLHPYPLVATSDSKGNVVIWGSRGCRWTGLRIAGFMNQTPHSAEFEAPVYGGLDNQELPRRALPPFRASHGEAHGDTLVSEAVNIMSADDEVSISSNDDGSTDMRGSLSTPALNKMQETEEEEQEEDNSPAAHAARALFEDGEAKWGRVTPAQCIGFDPTSFLLFTGDDMGNLRCFSLHHMMNDIGGSAMLTGGRFRLKDTCAKASRNSHSAPPPIFQTPRYFLLGKRNDAMAYMGVNFKWALSAHEDRILTCRTTPNGILTSGADRLVKMWTFEGRPVGTLLQSVPTGSRNGNWSLELDAEALMQREDKKLDKIIDEVQTLAAKGDNPDICRMTFDGIEPGSDAADFSRSELRQRIEQTSSLLGIDFPTDSERRARAAAGIQEDTDSDLTSVFTTKTKSLKSALNELKSSQAAVDYDAKNKKLSTLQKRRKEVKMGQVAKTFEQRGGIKVMNGGNPIGMSAEDALDLASVISQSAEATGSGKAKLLATGSVSGTAAGVGGGEDGSVSVSTISQGSKARGAKGGKQSTSTTAPDSQLKNLTLLGTGPRAESMKALCANYSSFDALDRSLHRSSDEPISAAEKEELLLRRQEKMRSLLSRGSGAAPASPAGELVSSKQRGRAVQSKTAEDVTENGHSNSSATNAVPTVAILDETGKEPEN